MMQTFEKHEELTDHCRRNFRVLKDGCYFSNGGGEKDIGEASDIKGHKDAIRRNFLVLIDLLVPECSRQSRESGTHVMDLNQEYKYLQRHRI